MQSTPDGIARDVSANLRQMCGERLAEVLLFGSWARGDADDESDLDLLVVLTDMESAFAEIRRMSDLLWDLSQRHNVVISAVPVSIRAFRDSPTAFLTRVQNEGRVAA